MSSFVDILLSFRSQKEFFRKKDERESFSLGKNKESIEFKTLSVQHGQIKSLGYIFENDSPEKQNITIKHILTMTSGFDYGVDPTLAPPVEGSVALHVLNSPVSREPGTSWVYDSQAPSILNRIIELQSNMSFLDYANSTLFHPLGIENPRWGTDDSGLAYGGFGLYLTSREMAKFGQLFLQEGVWEGEQLISKEWVQESTSGHIPDSVDFVYSVKPSGDYGYLWWIHDGFYIASGLHGQRIIVNPENDYV